MCSVVLCGVLTPHTTGQAFGLPAQDVVVARRREVGRLHRPHRARTSRQTLDLRGIAHTVSLREVLSGKGNELAAQAVDVNGVKVLAAMLDGADATTLREVTEKLKESLKTAVILLASVQDGKVSLVAGVTANSTSKVKAGELVNFVALQVGGKGGGRPDIAQAGGVNPAALPAAIESVQAWVTQKLA